MGKKPGKSGNVSKEVKVIINSSSILFINIGIIDFPSKPFLECLLPFNTFKGISTLKKEKVYIVKNNFATNFENKNNKTSLK